jgi:DNA-binding GntR family transcriptional regulator
MPRNTKQCKANCSSSSLKDMAYQTLRRMILTGELPAGTQITEAEIAEQLQVSRTPIRESIMQLEHEGLLRIVPYKGIFVYEMTMNDMRDLLQLRYWLELHAVEEAAVRVTDRDTAEMEELVRDQEQALQAGDMFEFMELDRRLHLRIAQAVGNAKLVKALENLRDQLVACGLRGLGKRDRAAQVLDEHREIIESLKANDPEGAVRAMNQHFVRVRDSVLDF